MKASTGCVETVEFEGGRRVNQPTTCLRLTANLIPATIVMAPLLPIENVALDLKGKSLYHRLLLPKRLNCA